MSLGETVSAMRETALFRNVDEKRLKLVAMMGETLSYRAGERLFERGDPGDAAFIVTRGAVDVLIRDDGHETVVATLGRGQIFGELGALCDQPRSTAIAAHDDLEVLSLDRDVIRNLMREFPDIALEMMRILATRLEATNDQLALARAELASLRG